MKLDLQINFITTSAAATFPIREMLLLLCLNTKPNGMVTCTKEWFYTEIDSKQRGDFKHMVISPLKVSFSLKRPNCKMNGATQYAYKAYNIVARRIGTQDLVREFLAYNVLPT